MERIQLFCDRADCQAHAGAWVHRVGAEEWIVEAGDRPQRFIESGVSPLCPLCGHPLLWPAEAMEGTAPASPEEQRDLTLWLSALPE